MKVQLADQSNIHVWAIEIEGPEQSVYAVCISSSISIIIIIITLAIHFKHC